MLEARGSVTDVPGTPLNDLVVTFCGNTCYGSRTDATGHFVIPIGNFLNREDYALHVDGRPDHVTTYLRFDKGDAQVIDLAAPFRLPLLPTVGTVLPADGAPASTAMSGGVTLAIAGGTTFDLDIADFDKGDSGRKFRAVNVQLEIAPPFASLAKVDAVYALAPSGATASAKMGVTLPNPSVATMPAGAAVDVLVLGDDYLSSPPTVGILAVAAAARVSADGQSIATDPGEGITKITWMAVRKRGN